MTAVSASQIRSLFDDEPSPQTVTTGADHTIRLPYQRNSDTSRRAAESARAVAPIQRSRVLAAIEDAGTDGLTREEIGEQVHGVSYASACARVNELVTRGQVRESGRTRLTSSGRAAAVLVACLPAQEDNGV